MRHFVRPLQTVNTNYQEKTKTALVSPGVGKNLVFVGATLNNRSGAGQIVGLGFKFNNASWLAGQWDDSAGASYIDDTTDAQDAGADDFALFSTVNNDGLIIQSTTKFSLIGMTVTTAEGGSPVYEYNYWNGSAWTTLTTLEVPSAYTEAEHTIAFVAPSDWAKVVTGDTPVDTDGLSDGHYAIRVRATTAPTTAPLASDLWVASLYDYKEDVSDNDVLKYHFRRQYWYCITGWSRDHSLFPNSQC